MSFSENRYPLFGTGTVFRENEMSDEAVGAKTKPFAGQTKIVNVNDMPWQDAKTPGIKFKVLYCDPVSGASTMLLKFEPGAQTPHSNTISVTSDQQQRYGGKVIFLITRSSVHTSQKLLFGL